MAGEVGRNHTASGQGNQTYPTVWAYEQACIALATCKAEIARLREELRIAQFDANVARGECDMAIASATQQLRAALDAIANFDPFQGGPIAPRSTPTEQRMRSVAREALSGLSSKKDQP